MSAVLLSEALFVPFMLLSLWGMAVLWTSGDEAGPRRCWLTALGTGLAFGAAILVKPSWALFMPVTLAVYLAAVLRRSPRLVLFSAFVILLGASCAMAPWWIRNARVYGRFVPTALWAGASLYDGLNPHATGASDMQFLETDELQPVDEEALDALLLERSWSFVRDHPGKVLRLAVIKAGRFWSPWPNADTLRSPAAAVLSAVIVVPIYALMLVGAWDRRRDLRALVLLGGPLLYFAVLHMVFVSSIRYRIPGAVPALGLAAIGFDVIRRRIRAASLRSSGTPESTAE
jgi:hypothetical protein